MHYIYQNCKNSCDFLQEQFGVEFYLICLQTFLHFPTVSTDWFSSCVHWLIFQLCWLIFQLCPLIDFPAVSTVSTDFPTESIDWFSNGVHWFSNCVHWFSNCIIINSASLLQELLAMEWQKSCHNQVGIAWVLLYHHGKSHGMAKLMLHGFCHEAWVLSCCMSYPMYNLVSP